MKILVVSLYFDPDRCQANGPLVRSLCQDLVDAGHEVTVLTSFPHYNCDAVWPQYRRRLFQREQIGDIRVIRSYIYVPRNKTILGKIFNYLSFNITSTIAGLFTGKQDVIFVMSPPMTIGLTAYVLGLIKHIPYCYNLQDIWPEVAVRLGILRNKRLIGIFERLEKLIYRHSRKVFAISDEFRQNLLSKGVDKSRIEVIPNFVDTDFIRPMGRKNSFSTEHNLTDKFVVLYAGNIGLSQGLEVIVDAAVELRSHKDILFLIVGQGISRDCIVRSVESHKLENVRFLPLQAEDQVPLLYASCDVAVVPLKNGITHNSLPCKTYSIMASGRPYIACVDEGSHVWNLTDKVGCGLSVRPEDGRALAEAVLRLQSETEARRAMGRLGREHVVAHFSRAANTARYRQAIESLVDIKVESVTRQRSLTSERSHG